MFLLVSDRPVDPDRHQHGVSIKISINLGKTFLPLSCLRKNAVTWFNFFLFPGSGLNLSAALIFIFIYFERCDTENQQK